MGVVANVSADTFPRQSEFNPPGTKCSVCFNYDTSRTFPGVIVRNDIEQPFVGIIRLNDGRHIRMEECQYQISK